MRYFILLLCLFVFLAGCITTSNNKGGSNQTIVETTITPCLAPIGGHGTSLNEGYKYSPSPGLSTINRSLLPHIIPDTTKKGWTERTFVFNDALIYDAGNSTSVIVQKIPYTIHISINNSVYYGARNSSKNLAVFPFISADDNYNLSYTAMIEDPNQNEMYSDLLHELRKYRELNHFDDDEYLEFITRFVQSIPYNETNAHKYPIEMVFENSGVCDDKSKLLAGLLERENYDVALFIVSLKYPIGIYQQHMFVGVKSNGLQYNGTNYSLIDTTTQSQPVFPVQYSYIGQPSLENIKPQVIIIKIGNGKKMYTKANEISFILDGESRIANDLNYKQNCPDNSSPSIDTLVELYRFFSLLAPNRNSSYTWFMSHNDTHSIADKVLVKSNQS